VKDGGVSLLQVLAIPVLGGIMKNILIGLAALMILGCVEAYNRDFYGVINERSIEDIATKIEVIAKTIGYTALGNRIDDNTFILQYLRHDSSIKKKIRLSFYFDDYTSNNSKHEVKLVVTSPGDGTFERKAVDTDFDKLMKRLKEVFGDKITAKSLAEA
jgi:hypothetical protein